MSNLENEIRRIAQEKESARRVEIDRQANIRREQNERIRRDREAERRRQERIMREYVNPAKPAIDRMLSVLGNQTWGSWRYGRSRKISYLDDNTSIYSSRIGVYVFGEKFGTVAINSSTVKQALQYHGASYVSESYYEVNQHIPNRFGQASTFRVSGVIETADNLHDLERLMVDAYRRGPTSDSNPFGVDRSF